LLQCLGSEKYYVLNSLFLQ